LIWVSHGENLDKGPALPTAKDEAPVPSSSSTNVFFDRL
jgi:hypothetical protein